MTVGDRMQLLAASWIAPMTAAPIRDGGIVIQNGRVVAIGSAAELSQANPAAEKLDLGHLIVLPGLINAHTHLELSGCAAGEPPASFVDWILSMPRRIGRRPDESSDANFASANRRGIEQCLRFGVTTIGDISQQMHITRPILRDSPLRAVSYGEVIGLGKRRRRFDELLPLAIDQRLASDRLQIGLTPHSPYTVEPAGFEQCLRIARELKLPLATHLAEIPDEADFIRGHYGPLQEMWEQIGFWEDFAGRFDGSPVAFADFLGLLDYPRTLLAHVNYCDDDDLARLARGRASVVYCPRTHRYFGHPPHRWREMLSAGINVAVGSDSCASSPDLNLLDDLRLLHRIAPDFPVRSLWEMATINAGSALGFAGIAQMEPGFAADLVVFDAGTEDPLRDILESDQCPHQVWIAGRCYGSAGSASMNSRGSSN
jgi:cytosine/adenosine deaminase-related metal-dependent hydrolase